jgi:small subunit ribosomal protein S16
MARLINDEVTEPMVVIRLTRGGSNKSPFYHVVVADQRFARDGRYIENLGFYNPMARGKATRLIINQERANEWIGKGAQPSLRVRDLIKEFQSFAIEAPKPAQTKAEYKKSQSEASLVLAKKKFEAEKAAAAKAQAESTETEAPASEETAE